MSDFIQVSLNRDSLQVNPGEAEQIVVTVQNIGNVVDVFSLVVEGLDASWHELSSSSFSLFPGDNQTTNLTINVPKTSSAHADTYPFTVKATSRKDPSEETTVSASLEVLPFYSYDAAIRPQRVSGATGSFTILLTNNGNTELTIGLEGRDREDLCRFAFSPQLPKLPAGESVEVNLVVEPGSRPWRGRPKLYNLALTATPSEGAATPQEFGVEFETPPRLPSWAIPAAIGGTLGLIVIIALVVALASRGRDDTPPRADATSVPQPAAPISLVQAQPLEGEFELAPSESREFEVLISEPGFLLIRARWQVTGNGLEITVETSDSDPAFLRQLLDARLPALLLEEDLLETEGQFEIPLAQEYVGHTIRIALRNATPQSTVGDFTLQFSTQPVSVVPAPTKTPTPTPTPTLTPTSAPVEPPIILPSPPVIVPIEPPTSTPTPTPAPRLRLSVIANPANGGTFTIEPPPDRDGTYAHGTTVKIAASPARLCTFVGWSGASRSTDATIVIELIRDTPLTANFRCLLRPIPGPVLPPLSILTPPAIPIPGAASAPVPTSTPTPTATPTPTRIPRVVLRVLGNPNNVVEFDFSPSRRGDFSYEHGTEVTVTAKSNNSLCQFDSWDISPPSIKSTTNFAPLISTITVVMTEGVLLTANFPCAATPTPTPTPTFTPTMTPTITPTPTISPTASATFAPAIKLTPLLLIRTWSLSVSRNPSTGGSVAISPLSIKGTYSHGTTVTATAKPGSGCSFLSWTEDISSSKNPITFTMTRNTSITANFFCFTFRLPGF